MGPNLYLKTADIWKGISFFKEISSTDLEGYLTSKEAEFLHVGSFYYYIFNLKTLSFDFISDQIVEILGYEKSDITVPFLLNLIHAEDLPYFVAFEKEVVCFFNQLDASKLSSYKVRYDYRVKSKSGEYIRILHQMVGLLPNNERTILKSLCYHTDITYLKPNGKPLLSFIGLNGEPSFVDVCADIEFSKPFHFELTVRERELVKYLAEGLTSDQIAFELNISSETVKTHRKNILRKLNLNSTVDLTVKAIREGWL